MGANMEASSLVVDDGIEVVGKQVRFVLGEHASVDILKDTLEQRAWLKHR